MKTYILNIILFSVVSKYCSASKREEKHFLVQRNKKLTNVEQFVKYGINKQQCFGQCHYFPDCQSVNVNEAEQVCVVNYDVVREQKENNIVHDNNWVYYEKKVKKHLQQKQIN